MKLHALAAVCLISAVACASDESNDPAFSVRLQAEGAAGVTVQGDSVIYDFDSCGTVTGTCNHGGIIFYPASNPAGFNGPVLVALSANNIPVVNGRLQPGSFPFNDVGTFDISAEFDTQDNAWSSTGNGTFTITTSTATRLAGSFQFTGYDHAPDSMPPVAISTTFDIQLP